MFLFVIIALPLVGYVQSNDADNPSSFFADKTFLNTEISENEQRGTTTDAGTDAWTFDWAGDLIVPDATFLNQANWTNNVADAGLGDAVNCVSDGTPSDELDLGKR